MKWLQNGNLAKLVAFFVIAVVITCTVSFAANGWQSFINEPSSDKITTDKITVNNKVDENNENKPVDDVPVIQPTDKFYHPLTGLETSLETSQKRPVCVSFESANPLYGISSSYLTVEFPTEYGTTRFLCFTDEIKSLGKIGALAPSRGYISNLATYFGGILLSYGMDDTFEYTYKNPSNVLDFKATSGYCYTEYNSLVYTNGDLVNAFLNNSTINQSATGNINLPYNFKSEYSAPDGNDATTVSITFSDVSSTQLTYSDTEMVYTMTKNASLKNDLLNDKSISYTNVFVLFANTTTYETESNTQLIVDTYSSGTGLYASMGKYIEITWHKDASGNLVFHDMNGIKLDVNRGTSYIAYAKASEKSSVKVS